MTEPEWKAEFLQQLEKAGEAQVRTEFHTLATGGEERRLCLVQWLREQELARQRLQQRHYKTTLCWAIVAAVASVVAAVAGVLALRPH